MIKNLLVQFQFYHYYFFLLNHLFRLTGISVEIGRLIPAGVGVISVWLLYVCFKRYISRPTALLASLFLALNLGHIFWSQSIRYYALVFCFQLLSMFCFIRGFESGRARFFLLSGITLVFAIFSHSSAVLLALVYFLFILLMVFKKEVGGFYCFKGYLLVTLILFLVLGLFAAKFVYQLQFQGALDQGMPIPSSRDPVKFLVRVVAYFGAPVVFLSIIAPFLVHKIPGRIIHFFVIAAFLPIFTLVCIAILNRYYNIGSVTWYYAFFALISLSILASLAIVSFWQQGRSCLAVSLGISSLLYYGCFLGFYHTTMHGGRPVWREATEYLQHIAKVDVESGKNPVIFATAPGVVAYYLGVDPAKTMNSVLVQRAKFHPPAENISSDWWLLLKSNYLNEQYQVWLDTHGELGARFDSKIGPFDQWSILVYHKK